MELDSVGADYSVVSAFVVALSEVIASVGVGVDSVLWSIASSEIITSSVFYFSTVSDSFVVSSSLVVFSSFFSSFTSISVDKAGFSFSSVVLAPSTSASYPSTWTTSSSFF